MTDASCAGMPIKDFFPDKNDHNATMKAQLICFECPVRKQCEDYSYRTDSRYGIWGGIAKAPSKG